MRIPIKKLVIATKNWLISGLYSQLFITIVSLPILLSWGLPFSIITPISNLIFAPVLTGILLLSSLVFFTEIIAFPNTWLIAMLSKCIEWYHAILESGSPGWLIANTKPSILLSFIIIISAGMILHAKFLPSKEKKIIGFLILLTCNYYYLYLQIPTNHYADLACHTGTISIIKHNKTVIIIDTGHLGKKVSSIDWVEYTLLPYLNCTFGSNTIDYFITLQPNIWTLQALSRLCHIAQIKKLYIPYWHNQAPHSFIKSFGMLTRICKEKNITIVRFGKKVMHIPQIKPFCIINPLAKTIPYHECFFDACEIKIQYNNDIITLMPYKCKNIDKHSSG